MRIPSLCLFVFVLAPLAAAAQQPGETKPPEAAAKAPSGTITGHVYLEDLKLPARKATVYLQPAAALLADPPPLRANLQDRGTTIIVEAAFDGSYSFTHVPNGSYFVLASSPGYISPYLALSLAESRSPYGDWQPLSPTQKAEKDRVLASLPRVDVQTTLPYVADVPLERGAAVSGTVTYDDGVPAAGLEVNVLARMVENGKETWGPFDMGPYHEFREVHTDDRGNYRISGLPARNYVVVATLRVSHDVSYISSSGGGSSGSNVGSAELPIYSGSTPRLTKAAPVTLQAGEERTGEDLRIPITKLHTVRGHIVSAHDGHVVNGGGVLLMHADDKSMAGHSETAEEDPSFLLYFVFDGEYILTTTMAADIDYVQLPQTQHTAGPPAYDGKPRHFYGSASMPLHVEGDIDNVTIAVPEPTAQEAQRMKSLVDQQEQQDHPAAPQ